MSKLASRIGAPSQIAAALAEEGFAARLREATKEVHREAERSGVIAELIRGRATPGGYASFLRHLVPVYTALETALDAHADTPLLSAFRTPELRRLPSLLSDLEAIGCLDAAREPLQPEAAAYARAVEAAVDGDGTRLAAHAYARYLGDLSGGRILKPILARSLGLTTEMLRFYDFPALADPEAAKSAMRQALDTIPAMSQAADLLIEEAIAAFRHNIALSLAVARAGCLGVAQ